MNKTKPEYPRHTTGATREKLHKTPFDLIPFAEIAEAYSKVAEHGAQKYDPWNWTRGLPQSQIMRSLLSHAFERNRGRVLDPDSLLPHAYHILWNAVALVYHEMENIGNDFRTQDNSLHPTQEQADATHEK